MMPISEVYNECNMIGMARYPDKFFDLAIVDPPFGIGKNWNKDTASKFYSHKSTYKNDAIPDEKYFAELFRISKYQIIWGCNYYWNYLTPTNNLIFWDKGTEPIKHFRSAGNLAWTNITKFPFNRIRLWWCGSVTCEKRSGIHPHEAPIKLYQWIFKHYAEKGFKILDTHMGSQSSRIAAYQMGFDYWGFEIDESYYKEGCKRFDELTKQQSLFPYGH